MITYENTIVDDAYSKEVDYIRGVFLRLDASVNECQKDVMISLMQLNDEMLQKLLRSMKNKIDIVSNELSEIDVNNITLDDLINFEDKIAHTITLADDISVGFDMIRSIAEDYNLVNEMKEQDARSIFLNDCDAITRINGITKSQQFKNLIESYNDEKQAIKPCTVYPFYKSYYDKLDDIND